MPPSRTSIEDVARAVRSVERIQEQLRALSEAVDDLTKRLGAIEARVKRRRVYKRKA